MKHELVKEVVKVKLELTIEELNTIVCGFGASSDEDRLAISKRYGVDIAKNGEANELYSDIKSIMLNLESTTHKKGLF